jgi:F420-non-reducing hydrogenase small subunit
MSKPKVAFYWCAACGGCEEAVVDLAEGVLDVVAAVDIVFWPVALDFKRTDVEALADGELAVAFVNGAIRTSEQLEMAELLRSKAQCLIAFGSCAHSGGIPGLANLFTRQELLNTVYSTGFSTVNPDNMRPQLSNKHPEGVTTLPELFETVKALDQVVRVDYYLPGCPPPVKLIVGAVTAILEGKLPPPGTVLAPDIAQCDECPRKDSKPEKLQLSGFVRPHMVQIDPEQCLLAQGLMCLGPVTRMGCDFACIAGNMPCSGCLGPVSRVQDYGAKALSGFATALNASDQKDVEAAMDTVVDPAGTFYRYSVPGSFLHKRLLTNGDRL